MTDDRVRVLIIDNFILTRQGLKQILVGYDSITVISDISTQELDMLPPDLKPDVIIVNAPTISHYNQINYIRKLLGSGIPVLVIISKYAELEILECLNAGIKGILCEDSTAEMLVEAINALALGQTYFGKAIKKIMLRREKENQGNSQKTHFIKELSHRETEVTQLFALGYSYKQIAESLHISPRTVESHKKNILTKLGLTNIAEIIKFAVKHGLIGN